MTKRSGGTQLCALVAVAAVAMSAGSLSAAQLTVSWLDNASDEDGFRIERRTGPEAVFAGVGVAAADATSYRDVGLAAGVTYCYRVSAFNGAGDSDYSNEACGVARTFQDVPYAHWAWEHVEALAAHGVTVGCGDLTYCPDATVDRAHMAVLLLRGALGWDYVPATPTGDQFADVPATHWAAAWIEELAKRVPADCGGGRYCPGATVTRAQMAVLLLRTKYGAEYQPPSPTGTAFGDVPAGHWAAAWIEQLTADGLVAGCASGLYCPESPVTRAEMAVFVVRGLGLPIPV